MASQGYTQLTDETTRVVPNTDGLTDAQALALQQQWGKNEIPEEKEPLWKLFGMQVPCERGARPSCGRRGAAPREGDGAARG